MKRILLFFSIILLLNNCTRDKIGENSQLYGSWKLTEWITSNPIDLNNNGISTTNFSPGCLLGSELIINDDFNGTLFYSSTMSFFTRMENNQLVYITSCITDSENEPLPITYTFENDTILLNNDGETSIFALDGDQLKLVIFDGFVAADVDTLDLTETHNLTFVFTRV
ncbi:MAG: hypothetical protein HKO92_00945 [Flavobacteriaceae bacterium]|nr:hypothetical protein [Flavobacteriaceae bacterium]